MNPAKIDLHRHLAARGLAQQARGPQRLGRPGVEDLLEVGERQAGVAVGGIVHNMPRFLEAVDQIALRLEIVFHDEDAHARLRSCR